MNNDTIQTMMTVVGRYLTDITPPDLATLTARVLNEAHEAQAVVSMIINLTKERVVDGSMVAFGEGQHMQLSSLSAVHAALTGGPMNNQADLDKMSASLIPIVHTIAMVMIDAASAMVENEGGTAFDPKAEGVEVFLTATTQYQRDCTLRLLMGLVTPIPAGTEGVMTNPLRINEIDPINMVPGPSTAQ